MSAPADALQGLNCVNNILRGMAEKLSETGQQNMIKALCRPLTSNNEEERAELLQVAAMREIRYYIYVFSYFSWERSSLTENVSALLLELGEGGLSMSESLANTIITTQLADRSTHVRLAAATCLRALSTALPKCI